MNTDLLIMAAGMGSRFGGLKQAAPIGENGEIILDYSVADAVAAGFNRAVIIIRKDIEKDFRAVAGKRIEKEIDVSYVYQTNVIDGYGENRTKPWGTGAAVLAAAEKTENPFAVINADDYYGKESYKKIHDCLCEYNDYCMVGYKLKNTLSENGSVSRGICTVENGFLKDVNEMKSITRESGIPLDSIASMNMWGLKPDVFDELQKKFDVFLKKYGNSEKEEFFLPTAINEMIKENSHNVKVIETDEVWYGITYKEDLPYVREQLRKIR